MQTDWGMVIGITITGLLVVFVALILLILCLYIIGGVSVFLKKRKEDKRQSRPKAKPAEPVQPEPIVDDSLEEETVAAITATVSLMIGQDKNFRIQSIRTAQAGVSWGAVGREEGTRPFSPFYQRNRR